MSARVRQRRAGPQAARGVTLIELVVTIAIISVALTAVLGALTGSSVRSAARIVQQQATAIAASYLEEIMQKSFLDPNGGVEGARAAFDDINDYNGLPDAIVRDQQDVPIAGLDQYQVNVQVVPTGMAGIPAGNARLINVTVTHQSGVTVFMSGYRTNQ